MSLLTACGSNQNLQEKAPAQFQTAYYTTDANSVKLYLPVSAIQTETVNLNSVYFKGRKADLELSTERSGLYVANFDTGKPDLIMSSDPRDEYANKVREVPEEIPFKLKDNEAVVVFTERGVVKFYKITGIEQR